MTKSLTVAVAALVASVALSACTGDEEPQPSAPSSSAPADPVEARMAAWVEDNVDPIWGDSRFLADFEPASPGADAGGEEMLAGNELYVSYADVPEDDFRREAVGFLEKAGYDRTRYGCADVDPESNGDGIVRTCGIHFERGELSDNNGFAVALEWHDFQDTPAPLVAVRLSDAGPS